MNRKMHRHARLRFMADPVNDGTPGAGNPPAADPDNNDPADTGKGSKQAVLADLARERDARQALEQTVAQMQQAQKEQMAAIASAFGVKPDAKDQDGTKLLTTLQQQVAEMQREALVLRVANEHKLAGDDVELLKSAKDEDAMTKLAARLASQATETPGTPKPDLSQGGKSENPKPEVAPGMARLQAAYASSENK